jgi:hypothetical protein
MISLLAAAGVFAAGLVGAVIGDLVSEEIRSRLDGFPRALVRLAARRLSAELREDRLNEWTGELNEFLNGTEARPVTRLVRGIHYAAGLLYAAPRIDRAVTTIAKTTLRQQTANASIIAWERTKNSLRGWGATVVAVVLFAVSAVSAVSTVYVFASAISTGSNVYDVIFAGSACSAVYIVAFVIVADFKERIIQRREARLNLDFRTSSTPFAVDPPTVKAGSGLGSR